MSYINKKMEPEPMFFIGEKVTFEVARGLNIPRWDYGETANIGVDLGASGIYANGTVATAEELLGNLSPSNFANLWTVVRYSIDGMIGDGYACFPKRSNPEYAEWQWKRPGYLSSIKQIHCECGGDKCNTTHSFWCPKFLKGATKK